MKSQVFKAFVACFTIIWIFYNSNYSSFNHLSAISECVEDKKCAAFCLAWKIKLVSANGDLDRNKIPFYDALNQTGMVKTCIEDNSDSDKCEKMKCLIAEGMLLVESSSDECAKLANVNVTFDLKTLTSLSKNRELKCYLRCMLLKLEIIGEDNRPKFDGLEKIMEDNGYDVEDVKILVEECANRNNQSDACEGVGQTTICVGMDAVYKIGVIKLLEFRDLLLSA